MVYFKRAEFWHRTGWDRTRQPLVLAPQQVSMAPVSEHVRALDSSHSSQFFNNNGHLSARYVSTASLTTQARETFLS